MKHLLSVICLIIPMLAFGASPQVSISIALTSGVNTNSPNVTLNRNAIMSGLAGLVVPSDRTISPAARHIVSVFEYGDMIASSSSSFNLWRARSPGDFTGEFGNRLLWSVVVRSTNGVSFESRDVWFDVWCFNSNSIPSLSGSLATNSSTGAEIRYSSTLRGLWYGSDRVKGTGDDVWYQGGESSTTSVDELHYIGVRTAFFAATASTVASAKDSILAPGFALGGRYYLRGGASTTLIVTPQPRISIAKVGAGGSLTVSGQPDVTYGLQATPVLSSPPSSIPWSARAGTYRNGDSIPISLVQPAEFFRLVQLSTAPLMLVAQDVPASDGASANDPDE